MTTTFERSRDDSEPPAVVVAPGAAEAAVAANRQRLASVTLVTAGSVTDHARGANACTLDEAFGLLVDAPPADLRALAAVFEAAPAYEFSLLLPYIALMGVAEDSHAARRRRAIRAYDVAVRRCIPAVLRSYGCREFSTELARLDPIDERSLATVGRLLAVVEVQIDRRVVEWYGRERRDARAEEGASALFAVRDELVLAARRYGEALIEDRFEAIGAWEGPAFALAAAGQAAGWDEISWWEFLGPILALDERPEPLGGTAAPAA